ncbi:MAG: arnC 1 [Gammaproteobacteria bacterium]|jgi:undecaprenyl-phosphate 4-deoxy-4-formamido-L-arabinose transferase|nr:arnC 1 [Gammaproteobacteria bacterium]
MKTHPEISIVIPVHNEQESLETLYQRLLGVMDKYGKPYEVILINDGSKDKSAEILNELYERRKDVLRIIHLNTNFGQHIAIMAGFERVRGDIIVTLDADLQNLPEDIPTLVEKMGEGYDVVGGIRAQRKDRRWRLWVSRWHNRLRAKIAPSLDMQDEGCMLRAYRRDIVDLMVKSNEATVFIPALALTYASNPTEVEVSHAERELGTSSYNLYRLIRYNFDLITGFSLVPLQIFTLIGVSVSLLSTLFVFYLLIRRLIIGPEAYGLFTLFAILFFLIGIVLMGLGITGEYIGRIYLEVRQRPRFVVKEIKENVNHTEEK